MKLRVEIKITKIDTFIIIIFVTSNVTVSLPLQKQRCAMQHTVQKNGLIAELLRPKLQKNNFRIGELNPGLVGTDHLAMIESDKS